MGHATAKDDMAALRSRFDSNEGKLTALDSDFANFRAMVTHSPVAVPAR